MSDRTIASHEYILQKWLTYQGDKVVAAITSQHHLPNDLGIDEAIWIELEPQE